MVSWVLPPGTVAVAIGLIAATDGALIGVLGTIVTGLFGLLGFFVKYLLDQLAKKDSELTEARQSVIKVAYESSSVLARFLDLHPEAANPDQATT